MRLQCHRDDRHDRLVDRPAHLGLPVHLDRLGHRVRQSRRRTWPASAPGWGGLASLRVMDGDLRLGALHPNWIHRVPRACHPA